MKFLAIDTSSKNCSVSICEIEDDKINVIDIKNNEDEKTHSQKLMPMIDKILKETKLTLDNIDILACCIGPGSFTGIRIGTATAKAFADVKNIKTIGVTSLESLAYNVEKDGYICSIIDCKNSNVYCAIFKKEYKKYTQIGENIAESIEKTLQKIEEVITENKEITFVGDGSIIYKNLIKEKIKNKNISFSQENMQSSISLAKCAFSKYKKGLYGNSNNISPVYLKKSQAERQRDGEK